MLLDTWFKAFVLTQFIEVPLYARALSRAPRLSDDSFRSPFSIQFLFTAFGASAITHPFVWFVFPRLLAHQPYWLYFLTAESFAVILEAWYLKSFGVRRFFIWSLLTNALSAGIGLLLHRFF